MRLHQEGDGAIVQDEGAIEREYLRKNEHMPKKKVYVKLPWKGGVEKKTTSGHAL
jgi:hypothetical protein